MYRHTEGNPLFVTEVVRELVQSGELTQARMRGGSTWSVRIPEGVREVIGRRLDRLSERTNETLTVATVIGRQFSLGALRAMTGSSYATLPPLPAAGESLPRTRYGGRGEGEHSYDIEGPGRATSPSPSSFPVGRGGVVDPMTESQLLDVLDEALAARIIEELPSSAGDYQFTHALIQETLTGELSAARRARLHARIAEALEETYGDAADEHAAELATHFSEAEPVLGARKLIHYSTVAGRRALDAVAYEAAVEHLGTAARAFQSSPMSTDSAVVLSQLGIAQIAVRDENTGVETLTRAFNYYADNGMTQAAIEIAARPHNIAVLLSMATVIRRGIRLTDEQSHDRGRCGL